MRYKVICVQSGDRFQRIINEASDEGYSILHAGIKGTSGGYFWAIMERGAAE